MYCWWLHILLYASVFSGKHAELFSDLAGMEATMETERVLLDSLNTYLKNQEEQLQLLRKQYDDYNAEYTMAKKDVTQYLGNPVNAFKIIKRLLIDWKNTQRIVEYGIQMEFLPEDARKLYAFPEEKDFSSAAEGLVRLQDVYNLDASELAEGKINGIQYYSSPMTASDCFGLGRHLFELQFYRKSFDWLNIALSKYEREYNKTMDKADILDFLAISAFAIGNFNTAVEITNEVLKIVPDHPRAIENLPIYELTLEITCFIFKIFEDALHMAVHYNENRKIHDGLCREDLELPEFVKKELKCRYFSGTHPFLRLAPFKLEEQYLEPYVVAFHEVMYDNEIQIIKELIHPHLERSGVLVDPSLEEGAISKIRISKSGWLRDEEHEVAARVSRRAAHFTGLAMESAEGLQVAVYGLAGHYETHFDFCTKDEENEGDKRIATVLFYMSDVEEGGNTVFPDIGVSVKPEKGMALFWLNLLPSGDGNFAMRHAACPVLRGSKYVCTKWIHQVGQELKKLCTLEYQEEGTHQEFPKPVKKHAPNKSK